MVEFKYQQAARCLTAGGVIAYPAESVWGLGCDPHNCAAVATLLNLKNRPVGKGLILVAASVEQFVPYLTLLTAQQRQGLKEYWPGHTTLLIPANDYVPPWIKGDFNSVALRVSSYSPLIKLCEAFGGPIVSTSANRAGRPSCRWSWQVHQRLGAELDMILGGQLAEYGKPSKIIHYITGGVLRN